MKSRHQTPSATSLPVAPRTEADARMRQYIITMIIRTSCVILIVVLPLGWWSWLLGIGAAFLPYVAVIWANNGAPEETARVESPTLSLTTDAPAPASDQQTHVITIYESTPSAQPAVTRADSAATETDATEPRESDS